MATRFADTTALFELRAGTGASRAAAKRVLQPRAETVTSEAVQREWKRIVVGAVGSIVEAVEKEPDLAAVFARLGVGFGAREGFQRWRAAALVTGRSDTFSAQLAKVRGRQVLRDVDAALGRSVASVRAPSRCGLAVAQPRQSAESGWTVKDTCKRREGICDHEGRLGRDLARWRKGAHSLAESSDNSLRKMGRTGLTMADEPDKRTGVNCYGKTGDLAIALDCQADELLVTTDKSFETMRQAMGFAVQRIPVK